MSVDVSGMPMIGSNEAPYAIVEILDFECPHCNNFDQNVFPDLRTHLINTGKVRFYSIDLPIDSHKGGARAARIAACAQEQGRFWQFRDQMRTHANELTMEALRGNAGKAGLDLNKMDTCLAHTADDRSTTLNQYIQKGLQGTPSFIIGKKEGTTVTGVLISGAVPLGAFQDELKRLQ